MKKTKQNYLSPTTETLVVRFEGNIMSPTGNLSGKMGGNNQAGLIVDEGADDIYDF